jgi:hypothetical protein
MAKRKASDNTLTTVPNTNERKSKMSFQFPKSVSDIQGSVTLPEGYYRMRLVQEPTIADNKKKRDGLSPADGAGQNFILKLRVISDDPAENGRAFTKYLPMPRVGIDENEFDQFTGQALIDKKMEAIVAWVEAFGGEIEEDSFDLRAGGEAAVKLIIEDRDGVLSNSISMNDLPKPL